MFILLIYPIKVNIALLRCTPKHQLEEHNVAHLQFSDGKACIEEGPIKANAKIQMMPQVFE
jgi:hypothetical protein